MQPHELVALLLWLKGFFMHRREFAQASLAISLAASVSATAVFAAAADRKFRVGVIGHTGRGNYGHSLDTAWLTIPNTEVVAVADADAAGLAAAQKRLSLATGFADYRDMLAKTKPDIVAIAPRYIDEHCEMALTAIDAGVQGIYMEKPFCRTPAEADAIVSACEKKNVKLAVAHRNRYHPTLLAMQRMLREGTCGKLLEIRARGKEDQRGGGLDLWVLGSHVLNLMHFFAGKPLACSATMLQNGRPATREDLQEGAEGVGPLAGNELHARYELEQGVTGYFDSIPKGWEKGDGFGLQLICTKGVMSLRIDVDPLAHFIPGNPFQPGKESARNWIPITSAGVGHPEPITDVGLQVSTHALAIHDLLAAVAENRNPLCSAHDGRITVEMITAAFASHCEGGKRITWPLILRENPLAKW
jgi:predicted dehydrogenase